MAASAYVDAAELPDQYESLHDGDLRQRMISHVARNYGDVVGDDPAPP